MRTGRADSGAAKYLLNTCVLSELVKPAPDSRVLDWLKARQPHRLYTSAMTWAELQRGVARLPESRRRTDLLRWLQQVESGFEDRILPFDREAALSWSQMTAAAQAQGKSLSAFDSIIAATARSKHCVLVTRNVRDFVNAGVDLINPWEAS